MNNKWIHQWKGLYEIKKDVTPNDRSQENVDGLSEKNCKEDPIQMIIV